MQSDIIVKLAIAVCECGYSTQYYKIKPDAIAAHNRVAKAAKEGEAK